MPSLTLVTKVNNFCWWERFATIMKIWLMEIWPKAVFCNVFLSKKFLFCLFQLKYPSQEHIYQNSIVLKLKAGLLFNDYHHHRHHPNLSHEIHSCPHMHDKDSDSRMIYM